MPLFEYRCKKCGHEFEALVPTADRKPKCEKCGAASVEKLLSSFSATHSTPSGPCDTGGCAPSSCATGKCPFAKG